MRQKQKTPADTAEEAIKNIRRATRRHWSAEDKIRIVLYSTLPQGPVNGS